MDAEERRDLLPLHLAAIIGLGVVGIFVGQIIYNNGITIGYIPRGTPINLLVNINSPGTFEDEEKVKLLKKIVIDLAKVQAKKLPTLDHPKVPNLVPNLLKINRCSDFVLDRGHTFGADLPDDEKRALIEYLKTI